MSSSERVMHFNWISLGQTVFLVARCDHCDVVIERRLTVDEAIDTRLLNIIGIDALADEGCRHARALVDTKPDHPKPRVNG